MFETNLLYSALVQTGLLSLYSELDQSEKFGPRMKLCSFHWDLDQAINNDNNLHISLKNPKTCYFAPIMSIFAANRPFLPQNSQKITILTF